MADDERLLDNLWIPVPPGLTGPRPKGSLRPFRGAGGRVGMREEVDGSTDWLNHMVNEIRRQVRVEGPDGWRMPAHMPWPGPVRVVADFRFTRTVADVKTGRAYPTEGVGDLDKLERNLGDALEKSGVIKDDKLIVDWLARKGFALPNRGGGSIGRPGVRVTVIPT